MDNEESKKSAKERVPENTLQPPPLIHAEGNGSSISYINFFPKQTSG